MSRLPLMAAALALSGCTFATTGARNTEIALTGLMALDTAQTVTIARSPDCLREVNPLAFFGNEHPSPQEVVITGVVYMAGHWALASYLDRKANTSVDFRVTAEQDVVRKATWRRLQRVYQWATGIGHGLAVANNVGKNIKPFSTFNCGAQQ